MSARYSVVRRSLIVVILVILGQAFNYLLILLANRSLDAAAFGRFYAAWATINILATPGTVLSLVATRYFAEAFRSGAEPGIRPALVRVARSLGPWLLAGVLATEIVFFAAGRHITDSWALALLLPVTAASFFGVEIVRAVLPAMLRGTLFGMVFFAWCATQCAFAIGALLLVHSVWSIYAGIFVANILALFAIITLVLHLSRHATQMPVDPSDPARFDLSEVLPFCSAYVGFVLFNNADILIAYFFFTGSQLGAYSAAAVLPKAIVMVTQPIAQVVLPLLVATEGQTALVRRAVWRAISVTAVLGSLGAAFLSAASPLVCSGKFGIRYCDPKLMTTLAVTAVLLALVRVAITVDLGQRLYWLAQVPFAGCLVFAAVQFFTHPSPDKLAMSYLITSLGTITTFGLLSFGRMRFKSMAQAQ
ncbi:MAG TPA: hypothetical protein VGG22_06360 [Candidatus Baltobacteraceae bacterium]